MNEDEQYALGSQKPGRDFVGNPHIHHSSSVDKTDAATGAGFSDSVELHIEELLLYGFEPGDRYRIGDAAERELARLFADRGVQPWLARGGGAAMLDVGEFNVAQGSTPEAIGTQVARAIYGGLDR